ncbi:MAG: hypothetical protein WDA60_00780 [Acidimicrobiia bacterium]
MGRAVPERTNRVGTFRSFARDLARAWRVWRRDWRLPVAALLVALASWIWSALAVATGWAGIAIIAGVPAIYFIGFSGTEQVWCVRVEQGLAVSRGDAYRLTSGLRWRYCKLGALFVAIAALPTIVVVVATAGSAAWRVGLLAVVLTTVSALMHFARVAAAFNDVRARDALRHSIAVLRQQWPQCAAYVLVPPVVVGGTSTLLRFGIHDDVALLALGPTAAVVSALCTCATVLYYADRYPTLRDGSDTAGDAQLRPRSAWNRPGSR